MRATRTGALIYLTTALVLGSPLVARGMLPGGGNPTLDCFAEFEAPRLRLSYPPFDPARPKAGREVRCFDGDPACDLDGAVNHSCQFDVDVCLFNADPALPTCSPTTVTEVKVAGTLDPDLMALSNAIAALLPASSNVCTSGRTLAVPLKPTLHGYRGAAKSVRLNAKASGTDLDSLKLVCLPRGWTSHGYDERNRRATPSESAITPANASTLTEKWTLDLQAREGGAANGVTSTPTVADGTVYVTSWNGKVYAVDARSGRVRWTYDTGTGGGQGVQSSATLTADGRVLVGDSAAALHCLEAKNGKRLWRSTLGDAAVDHIWGSPSVANGRVYMGIASHNDNPCTQGRVVALDLDTGVTLWTRKMVPDRICDNDTSVTCTVDAECGGGSCVPARGAGVTATVAVDPLDDAIYLNTVGCYTFPSVGDSDSIMKLDGASGSAQWIRRVQPPEQFKVCDTDPSIECTPSTVCPSAGSCTPKAFYHDFGFLNGPLLVDADDGLGGTRALVVSGSKDGSLYALDRADGSIVWQRAVLPTPVTPAFAGFGLFDGAIAFADDRFHAALYEFIPQTVPEPPHRQAFSAVDGSTVWSDDIGAGWGSVSLGGGVSYAGTLAAAGLYVHDAATGARLATLDLPSVTSSGASIVDGTVYVGYGIFGAPGGVRAFTLP
ncbi:PQQ-binding-like beta-propeller repeat protein [Candidatus Binatia bacterium]|nr:PQQ-binding-like beta-propeller repeat protein [Candidatus Binatia bacterium]